MRPYAILAATSVLLLLAAGCTSGGTRQPQTHQAAQSVATSPASAANPAVRTSARPLPSAAASSTASSPASPPRASASRTSAPVSAPTPRTQQIVRRPVTSEGKVTAGYAVVTDRVAARSDCGDGRPGNAYPSPPAVDAGVVGCGPSAEYTPACWNGATATTAYCYRDPWQRQVVRISTAGRLPALRPPTQPSPLGLVLGNGSRCTLRVGGAWASLDSHPDMYGTYSCQGGDVIWGTGRSDGIDRTSPLWKVRLAPGTGHGTLHEMTVRTAYFVGTAQA